MKLWWHSLTRFALCGRSFFQGTGRLVKAFKAPREAETPEMREHRQQRLEYNIIRSKQSKVKAEEASGSAAPVKERTGREGRFGGSRSTDRRGESRGRSVTRSDDRRRSPSSGPRMGGRSGARMRSPSPSRGADRGAPRGGRRDAAPSGSGDAKPFRSFRGDAPERSRSTPTRSSSAGQGRSGGDDVRKSRSSGGSFGKARSSSPRGSSAARSGGRR